MSKITIKRQMWYDTPPMVVLLRYSSGDTTIDIIKHGLEIKLVDVMLSNSSTLTIADDK